jgi:hypothetical protein
MENASAERRRELIDRLNSRGATFRVALGNLEGEIIRQAPKETPERSPRLRWQSSDRAASGERKVLDPSGAVPLRRGTFLPQDVDARAKLIAVSYARAIQGARKEALA